MNYHNPKIETISREIYQARFGVLWRERPTNLKKKSRNDPIVDL
jgi:hypothetical protein